MLSGESEQYFAVGDVLRPFRALEIEQAVAIVIHMWATIRHVGFRTQIVTTHPAPTELKPAELRQRYVFVHRDFVVGRGCDTRYQRRRQHRRGDDYGPQ
jgi:hypothetical protein